MTPSPANERLNFVLNGPWTQQVAQAEEFLDAQSKANISLRSSIAGSENAPSRIRSAELSNMFRGHWHVPIRENELIVRSSFRNALDILQLLELGVESNYYQVEDIREVVISKLGQLFWPQAAVDYVNQYNYLLIRYIACRFEFNLGLPVIALPTQEEDEIAYAGFLLTFAQMQEDDEVKEAIDFMYKSQIYQGLALANAKKIDNNGSDLMSVCSSECIRGFYKIISYLDDIFEIVSDSRKKYFALIFSDWLSIFNGYVISQNGYNQLPNSLIDYIDTHAYEVIETSGYKMGQENIPDEIIFLLKERIRKIKLVWLETQNEIESTQR